ncbi:hypothetical protein [Halopiger goleimassiliensis]|nr:hypothetical protein [Halopiger goleimassiliensis]
MAYQLRCDSCDLERECTDWADANRHASEHEAEYVEHWVSIYERQEV